jgi:hypothetical protein
VKWPPACEDVSSRAKERPLMKTQRTEKLSRRFNELQSVNYL